MDQHPPKKERTPAQLAAFERCLAARNASLSHKQAALQPAPAARVTAPVVEPVPTAPLQIEPVPVEPMAAPAQAEEAEEDEFLDGGLFLDEINATRREMAPNEGTA